MQRRYILELSAMFCGQSHRRRAVKVTLSVIPYRWITRVPAHKHKQVLVTLVQQWFIKSNWGLGPCPIVGVSLLWAGGAVCKSEEGGEGAVIWCSLPVCEHGFLFKALRPVRIRRIPLVDWASPLVTGLGQGVERRQGSELRQVTFVEFISILRVGREAGKCIIGQTYIIFKENKKKEDVDARLLPSCPFWRYFSYGPDSTDKINYIWTMI